MGAVVPVVVTFLAILALVALAAAIVLFLGPRGPLLSQIGPVSANLAWGVAVVATLGSLFLSEIANFIPCLLCWVQRGFMYPLAIALAFAPARRSRSTTLWALAGSLVSIYHYAVEQIPSFSGSDFCSATIPCSFIWVEEFGFVTIPFMAMCGFLAVAALTATHRKWLRAR